MTHDNNDADDVPDVISKGVDHLTVASYRLTLRRRCTICHIGYVAINRYKMPISHPKKVTILSILILFFWVFIDDNALQLDFYFRFKQVNNLIHNYDICTTILN